MTDPLVRLPLPIDAHLDRIVREVRRARAVVIVAAPGAGKTTRVPPALAGDGRVLVLQPRRVAARAIARRIALEQAWTLGDEVGWHVRFERRFTRDTRVVLATEGILTARLQQDPLASDVTTIVIDEFHERSIHADLGLALARQAQRARGDLRLVVMSATLDAAPRSGVPGRLPAGRDRRAPRIRPTIDYAPEQPLAVAVRELSAASRGQVLCFLPGAGEIARARDELARLAPSIETLPLHGSLDGDEQDRALDPAPPRGRVILATNLAETSLTVPARRHRDRQRAAQGGPLRPGARHRLARRSSASRSTAPISARAAPPVWGPAACGGCGIGRDRLRAAA